MRSLVLSSTAAALLLTSAACTGQEANKPPEATATSAPEARNQPVTVTGCLRAGEAANTFVLMAPASETSPEPATYALVGTAADLGDHVDRRVEIAGTLASEQEARSSTSAVEEDKPKGTTGTPTVETQTKVEVRRIKVDTVRPLGEECEP